jgi:hypothetical protein
LVRQDDAAAKQFIEAREEVNIGPPYIGLVVEYDGRDTGAFILNDYTPPQNIEMSAVITGHIPVCDLRDIFRYCFARVSRITARTSVNNLRTIHVLQALGFRREGVLREWFVDGSDAVVFGLLKSEQKITR